MSIGGFLLHHTFKGENKNSEKLQQNLFRHIWEHFEKKTPDKIYPRGRGCYSTY